MLVCVCCILSCVSLVFFFKQKTAYEMRISDWSSDVCSSDLGIQELELDLFLSIWSTIKKIRKKVWSQKSHLLQKVSIYALTYYILESMVAKQRNEDEPVDFTDDEALTELVTRVINRIPEAFWAAEWTVKEIDKRLGRKKLLE